ncbi:unnamed protein product [Calicophoron daubneyi]|uniref:Bcl-2 Bcl-2 homology region 1-3 domain-containing protein n=1 Tax=Calicophoron daubneyi TaxID=300641 RepID=A0AAV2TUB3_CALDB
MKPHQSNFQICTFTLCQSFILSSLDKADERRYLLQEKLSGSSIPLSSVPNGEKIVACLLELVKEFDNRVSQLPTMTVSLVSNSKHDSVQDSYIEVLDGVLDSKNWGRIVAVFAFLRMLALELVKRGREDEVVMLIELTSSYCTEQLRSWITSHGGWSALLYFVHSEPIEDNSALCVLWKIRDAFVSVVNTTCQIFESLTDFA